MTINEFKCWLDGFNNSIDGAPNVAQWNAICEKINELRDLPVNHNYCRYSAPMITSTPWSMAMTNL